MEKQGILTRFKARYIGDRAFYRSVIVLVIPLIIQQGITSFVNLLDNVMVGALSTAAISGVAIVNQLMFVFNLSIFGSLSGPSIFSAQYAGVKDEEGVRQCFRFKIMLGAAISAIAIALFVFYGDGLINLYLNKESNTPEALAATLSQAKSYLSVMIFGLPAFMLTQCYSSTLRENAETIAPMRASIISILTNLVLNYVLIYGKLGAPALGVTGAAIATVAARYVEMGYLMLHVYRRREKYPFFVGALAGLRVPAELAKKIAKTGAPLLLNEFLWSSGMATINRCYSVRGLDVVAATNITSTVWQVFAIMMFAMGSAVSIMVGQRLGAGDIEGAKQTDRRLLFTTLVMHIGIGALIVAVSGLVPQIYNVEQSVKDMTQGMLVVAGCVLWIDALTHAAYFTIRSGGRTIITFLMDSAFTWAIVLPTAYMLCNWTQMDVVWVYACVQMVMLLKLAIVIPILASGSWARNVIF